MKGRRCSKELKEEEKTQHVTAHYNENGPTLQEVMKELLRLLIREAEENEDDL